MTGGSKRTVITQLLSWPARRPVVALILAGAAMLVSIIGVLRMSADASVQSMFPRGDPAAAAMGRVLNDFSAAGDLLILATLPQDRQAEGTAALLAYADRLEQRVLNSPQAAALVDAVVYRADEQTRKFFERVLVPAGIYYLSDSGFAAARRRLTHDEMARQIRQNEAMISAPGPAAGALSATLLQDPLRLREFITAELNDRRPFKSADNSDAFLSPDSRSLLIRIVGKKSLGDLEFAKAITSNVSALAAHVNTDGFELDISGGYAIAAASERTIRHDMVVSVISSVAFLQLLFIAAYRRPVQYFLLAFVPVAIGIIFGFGVRSLLSSTISPLAAVVGAVLAGLGIDYTVLYLPNYQAARARGASAIEAARQTATSLAATLLAACVTSIIGFIAIGWSSVAALRDFALVGSLGLCGALIASLWVLPAMLVLIDRREDGPPRSRLSLAPLFAWIAGHRRLVMAAACAVLAAGVAVIALVPGQLLPLESDLTVMHPRPNPPLDAQAKIARRMGTDPGAMLVYLRASSADELVHVAYEVQTRLSSNLVRQAGVVGTYGLSTLLPDPAIVAKRRAAISANEVDGIVANFKAAIADSSFDEKAYAPYAAFLRHLLSGPPAPTVADLVPYHRLAETMLSRAEVSGNLPGDPEAMTLVFFNRPLDDRANRVAAVDAVRHAVADVPGATVTGLGVISLDTEQAIQRDLPRLLSLASLLVAVYLLVHFRSVSAALLALLPGVFSLICLFAFMRLTGQALNLVNLIALPLLVGIDVDYGIFLVSLSRRRPDDDNAKVPAGILTSGYSVMVSAAANVLGFGSLITTSVPAIRTLGWAVGVGVAACFIGSVFLLAPMLMGSRRVK